MEEILLVCKLQHYSSWEHGKYVFWVDDPVSNTVLAGIGEVRRASLSGRGEGEVQQAILFWQGEGEFR